MWKNFGQKNSEFNDDYIREIIDIYFKFEESEILKIFENVYFGYYKIIVERLF